MSLQPIRVLKFGSSVLSSKRDVARALHEIYAEVRGGARVVVVVSARGGTTDELLARARRVDERPEESALALLLSTGEAQSGALLALALERAGISTALLDPARIGLRTRGPLLDAEPVALDADVVRGALREKSVAVVPGFTGRDAEGRTSLFGRGGSDLTALFLAQRLRASCRLVKDVAGVFDRDPARDGAARRYATLSFDDALACGGRVVQAKALRFAREHGLEFEVGALGESEHTLVGRGPSRFAAPGAPEIPLRVALLGLGTVGLGVYRELVRLPQRFEVGAVLVRRDGVQRPPGIPSGVLTTDVNDARFDACDVLVEVLGGTEPAGARIESALRRGAHVVSANKALAVERGAELHALARANGTRVLFSAAVCGALPVLEVVRSLRRKVEIASVEGILNGTTNVVLDSCAAGATFVEALERARRDGFCESDPSEDLDGTDAARKLVLVAREAFGDVPVRWIERRGIADLDAAEVLDAARTGASVKLVAACRRTQSGVDLSLAPRRLDGDHALARVRAERNAVSIRTADGRDMFLCGKGAGRWPTAQSVVGDLLEVARDVRSARARSVEEGVAP